MTESGGRRFAWTVFGLVVAVLCSAMFAMAAGTGGLGERGRALTERGGDVVVVGAPGLTWSDITEEDTPVLMGLMEQGMTGGLIVRGTHVLTCPADGWLTLGAGQRASADDDGVQDCAAVPEVVPGGQTQTPDDDLTATIPEWSAWTQAAARRPLDAQLGTLTDAHQGGPRSCVRAGDPLSALGAADSAGTVTNLADNPDHWRAAYDPLPCDTTLLDAGTITGPDDALALDSAIFDLISQLPEQTTLVVAGLADRGERAGVRAVIVWHQGSEPGTLSSPSTRQPGLVQTTDLTATILALQGLEVPPAVSGQAVESLPTDAPIADRLRDLQDLSKATAGAQQWAYAVLAVGAVVALAALVLLHRLGQPGGMRLVGLAVMAFPSSAFLAGLVPWWRGSPVWLTLALVLAVLVAAHVALALAGPWRRHPLGPPVVVAAITVVVLGVDVILGGPLGLISILGVQPVTAGRFYGMGNVGYGIFAASGLLLAGQLASLLRSRPLARRRAACLVVAVLGLLLVLIDGHPSWGADFGGVPALVVALGVLGLAAAQIRLTPARAMAVAGAAVLVAAALMILDWLRPAGSRTHLGDFVQSVLDGGAVDIVARKLDQSLGILVRYPVSWVAVLVLVAVIWAVLAPDSRLGRPLEPLWRIPLLHATVVAVLVCLVIGWALNDSGIAVVGIGLAVAIAAVVAIGAGVGALSGVASAPADSRD